MFRFNQHLKIKYAWPAVCLLLASSAGFADEGVPIHGFADVGYGRSTAAALPVGQVRSFTIGTFDLYLTPQFSDNVKALAELALDVSPDMLAEGIDAERLQLGYVFSDALTVWAGRFHTPYGYWQTTFHHGAQIQPSVYKPGFLDWEDHNGNLLPHSVGLWFTGKFGLGEGKLIYDAYLTNGSRIIGGRVNMNLLRDDNTSLGFGGRLSYRFAGALDGLTVGVHGLSQEVDTGDVPLNSACSPTQNSDCTPLYRTQVVMYGGYLSYESSLIELSSEYYAFSNTNLGVSGSGALASWEGFAHLGVLVTPDWIPYVRVERTKLNQNDGYFNQQINGYSYDRILYGIRYNVNARACIKLEGNHTTINDNMSGISYGFSSNGNAVTGGAYSIAAGTYDEVRAQYAISF